MDYKKICEQVCHTAKETGNFIREQQKQLTTEKVESKGLHNYVTYVDKTAEKMLVDNLQKLIPDAGFIVEEGTITKTGAIYNWIIDPLDGTTNYIHGLPPFAISIALQENDKIVIGVIYEINLDECFYAWKESPAYLNQTEIKVSNISKVTDSLIATGFPYYDYSKMDRFMLTVEYFMKNSHGLRRLGSAATDLAYVACGRFEGFYEYGLSPWDVAAGAFIVQQAGGKVSDFKGGENYIFGAELIATNRLVYNELFSDIKKIMVD
jgi:myo-inositol-1(or 4)-monophosphatase